MNTNTTMLYSSTISIDDSSSCLINNTARNSCKIAMTPNNSHASVLRHPAVCSSNSSTCSSTPPISKSVRFASTCKVKRILHVNDYTEDELSSSWYSDEESSDQRQKCARIIRKIAQGKPGTYCVRGLARMTPRAVEERDNSRMDALLSVLREQNKQCLMAGQIMDVEEIARKYQLTSATRHQEEAYKVGRMDAKVAQIIVRSKSSRR
jgi:hypothetical protein